MKIQGNRPEFEQPLAGRVDRPGEAGGPQGTTAAAPSAADHVSVSADAQLASAAIAAAEKTPDVRPEAVARGRALLESGTLGADTERLADKLIDRALDS